jgi:ribosomal-protein-alanine N-acetyltransferase
LSAGWPPDRPARPPAVWIERPDPEELWALDAACFSAPWDAAAYAEELLRPERRIWVLRSGPPPRSVGFAVCQRVEGEVELLRLGVVPGLRNRGWGKRLLAGVLARLAKAGARRVFLEVREGNRPALALYESAGFREVSRRRHYYTAPPEDAVVMARDLGRRR